MTTLRCCCCSDHYVTAVRWRDDDHVLVVWSNRYQNHTVVTVCHVVTADCHVVGVGALLFSPETKPMCVKYSFHAITSR